MKNDGNLKLLIECILLELSLEKFLIVIEISKQEKRIDHKGRDLFSNDGKKGMLRYAKTNKSTLFLDKFEKRQKFRD